MSFLEKLSDKISKISYTAYRFLLLALGGILTGLTLVFPKMGFVEWITLIPVATVIIIRASDKKIKLRSLYLDALVFFYSFFLRRKRAGISSVFSFV